MADEVISGDDIINMFKGLSELTKQVILRELRPEFEDAITGVNKLCAAEKCRDISPSPELILNAFRLCPVEKARVVLLGQDPYINPGQAQGLSFSVPVGFTIPPSLRTIYKCMMHHGLITQMPGHGDLTSWAKQGVLMYNAALTTRMKKSGHHQTIWAKYSDALIRNLCKHRKDLIFILLGNEAKAKAPLATEHTCLVWGHPSPMNSKNKTDNPENFINCTVFSEVNRLLADPIDWNTVNAGPAKPPPAAVKRAKKPAEAPVAPRPQLALPDPQETEIDHIKPLDDTVYVFTDGGATGNGRANCRAAWAYCRITSGATVVSSGMVPSTGLDGSSQSPSNNRGELLAILYALRWIQVGAPGPYRIVSDSEYSIKCITSYAASWLKKPGALADKKNTDLIIPAHQCYVWMRANGWDLSFIHVRSHKNEPSGGMEWFLWKGNDTVDKLCQRCLV